MCKVPLQLNRDILAAYLSAYGSVKEVTQLRSTDGMTHRDYANNVCMNREGFQAILRILTYKDLQMMVIVEGRRSLCWSRKQLSHLARFCPKKNPSTTNNNINNTKDKSTSPITKPTLKPEDPRNGPEKGLT